MDEPRLACCVGIDVSKDRLDVHLRPSDEAFAVARDGKGLENLVERLKALNVSLIVLEATGGFETTVAAAVSPAPLCRSPSSIRAPLTSKLAACKVCAMSPASLAAVSIRLPS